MTDITETRQTSDEGSELERIDKDLVDSNRAIAVELGGMSLAATVPGFLFAYSATYYERVIRSVSKGGARAISYLRIADSLLMFGLILFAFEPVLILSTIRLMELALAAFVLWVVGIVFTLIIK